MDKKISSLDRFEKIKPVRWLFFISGIIVSLWEFFIFKFPHFPWEKIYFFNAFYGFISCLLIVLVSKLLGKIWLQKKEKYYD